MGKPYHTHKHDGRACRYWLEATKLTLSNDTFLFQPPGHNETDFRQISLAVILSTQMEAFKVKWFWT